MFGCTRTPYSRMKFPRPHSRFLKEACSIGAEPCWAAVPEDVPYRCVSSCFKSRRVVIDIHPHGKFGLNMPQLRYVGDRKKVVAHKKFWTSRMLILGSRSMKVIGVGALDFYGNNIALAQRTP